jgi:hypothetical protein
MPARPRSRNKEGRWNPTIFFLLLWQFMAGLVVLVGSIGLFWFTKCFKTCEPLKASDMYVQAHNPISSSPNSNFPIKANLMLTKLLAPGCS